LSSFFSLFLSGCKAVSGSFATSAVLSFCNVHFLNHFYILSLLPHLTASFSPSLVSGSVIHLPSPLTGQQQSEDTDGGQTSAPKYEQYEEKLHFRRM